MTNVLPALVPAALQLVKKRGALGFQRASQTARPIEVDRVLNNRGLSLAVVTIAATCAVWVAYWMGSEDGFLLARRGTYATEYADVGIAANLLECDTGDLHSNLLKSVELRAEDLKMLEETQHLERPLWKRVVAAFYESPKYLSYMAADKPGIPPLSKLQEQIARLKAEKAPATNCNR